MVPCLTIPDLPSERKKKEIEDRIKKMERKVRDR